MKIPTITSAILGLLLSAAASANFNAGFKTAPKDQLPAKHLEMRFECHGKETSLKELASNFEDDGTLELRISQAVMGKGWNIYVNAADGSRVAAKIVYVRGSLTCN